MIALGGTLHVPSNPVARPKLWRDSPARSLYFLIRFYARWRYGFLQFKIVFFFFFRKLVSPGRAILCFRVDRYPFVVFCFCASYSLVNVEWKRINNIIIDICSIPSPNDSLRPECDNWTARSVEVEFRAFQVDTHDESDVIKNKKNHNKMFAITYFVCDHKLINARIRQ